MNGNRTFSDMLYARDFVVRAEQQGWASPVQGIHARKKRKDSPGPRLEVPQFISEDHYHALLPEFCPDTKAGVLT